MKRLKLSFPQLAIYTGYAVTGLMFFWTKHLQNLKIRQYWRKRLEVECPQETEASRESIIRWLMASDSKRFDTLKSKQLDIAKQVMEYRYRILIQRYLGLERELAYHNLIKRLASSLLLRKKIKTWISLSRYRQRTVLNILEKVLQELLQSDHYIQQQMVSIQELTDDMQLQNSLLLAALEEYCLRPVRNQPLLVSYFIKYLSRTQRGDLT